MMKTIYLDKDYMCHLTDDGTMTGVQTDVFDGSVDAAIPYYRYIPEGESWRNPRGLVLHGLFVQATDSEAISRATQQALIADMQDALEILGVTQ